MASATSPKKAGESPRKSAPEKKKVVAKKESDPAADIRNFFSQGTTMSGSSKPSQSSQRGVGRANEPIMIDDSDDEIEAKPASKPVAKATSSKHFPNKPSSSAKPISTPKSPEPTPASKSKPQPASSSKKPIPTTVAKRRAADPDSDSDLEEVRPAAKRQSLGGARAATKKSAYVESSDEDEDMEEEKPKVVTKPKAPAAKAKPAAKPKKAVSPMDIDELTEPESDFIDDDDEDEKPAKKAKAPAKKAPAKKAPPPKKAPAKAESSESKKDDVKEEDKKPKFNYRAYAATKAAGPANPGSKDIPEGQPDCLAGLTFVFTGELDSLSREDATELVKRYAGKTTTAPSKKTDYVVLGTNAGPSKVAKIETLKLKTLDEDRFLDLIRTSRGKPLDEKALKAREKEEKKIVDQAKEMEKREREEEKLRKRKEAALQGTGIAAKKTVPISAQLWTTKYAPQNIKEICGNKAPVERLGQWLEDWDKNYKSGFKKPGKEGMGIYRAVLISGPPGIGKTTSAHLMAKSAGYNPIELNASDARSKKLVENQTNIDNTSLDGFFQGTGVKSTTVIDGVKIDSKTCLIMDEVDGMSAGDRGGVGALNTLIRKTRIPMILICNDRTLQKMKPLQSTTFNMTFRRPQANEIRSRLMTILYKEKMKIPANVLDELVKGANSDIRQVLNMMSTFKLGKDEMDFDEGKALAKVNEKNTIMTPFTIIDKLTGPYAFSKTSRDTLGDKMELYFHDFSFVPLFMQEHYIKTAPSALNQLDGPDKELKHLDLLSKAADSISDGDLIDRMIHGSEQHWSLLPLHAVASTVKPASYIYGGSARIGGPAWGGPSFPAWLGQNSKQNKLGRQLTDIQIRMRLKASGSRQEIREQYMPMLASKILLPMVENGQDAIDETIEYMDSYYLGKEDWDSFVELGVDQMKDELILKKIPTAVKSAFTRQYNKKDHPIAFHKGDMFAASKKKLVETGPAPDNDDVFEDDGMVEESDTEKPGENDDVNDIGKDKLIKAVKAKGKAAAKPKPKPKKK